MGKKTRAAAVVLMALLYLVSMAWAYRVGENANLEDAKAARDMRDRCISYTDDLLTNSTMALYVTLVEDSELHERIRAEVPNWRELAEEDPGG